MKLISIIVPVYKVEVYLQRCVESVLSQTYKDWELILVDDGSPDNCPQICDDYALKDCRIKVIHKENGGLSSARNEGLHLACGTYIMFLDSDDYIHSQTLQDVLALATENNADIVQFSFIRGNAGTFPLIEKSKSPRIYDNYSIFHSTDQKVISCAKLYKRDLWDGINFPVGKVNEDDATTWKLYYRASRVVYIDTPYYYYYENPNSIMANQKKHISLDFIKIYQERIAFFREEKDDDLVRISQWRFCMPLMLVYMRGNITQEEKNRILSLFKDNVKSVITYPNVPIKYRLVLGIFSICPPFFRWIFETFKGTKTLNENTL